MKFKKRSFGKSPGARAYGLCVLCGDRVYNSHDYIESKEGYCHKSCLPEA